MLKIFSAVVLATSIVAAPAMAATIIKTEQASAKVVTVKRSPLNAQAKVVVVKKVHRYGHRAHLRHPYAHRHAKAVVIKKVVRTSAIPAKTIIVKKKI